MTFMQSNFRIHPTARIGYVSLNVSDLDRSLDFYENILGFKTVSKLSEDKALLSVDGKSPSHLIELQAVQSADRQVPEQRKAGLYHFAILLPERKYLADILQNLREKQNQVHFEGLADHLVSESIYIRDPDFNGIEVYCDWPPSEWIWSGSQVRMSTMRLDTEKLSQHSTASGWKTMPANTVIGHIHLHVTNLAKAMMFYSNALGLNFTASYAGAYFFAAGRYHHHVATNTWLGTEIMSASPDKIGLNHFGIELPDNIELEKTLRNILGHGFEEQSRSAFVNDADGIMMRPYSK